MLLSIISPSQNVFSGEVSLVSVPGTLGRFTILDNHAALISTLGAGEIVYKTQNEEQTLQIASGLVEVNKNVVTICVE